MDEPGGHYIELNKPGAERQMSLDLVHLWNLNVSVT